MLETEQWIRKVGWKGVPLRRPQLQQSLPSTLLFLFLLLRYYICTYSAHIWPYHPSAQNHVMAPECSQVFNMNKRISPCLVLPHHSSLASRYLLPPIGSKKLELFSVTPEHQTPSSLDLWPHLPKLTHFYSSWLKPFQEAFSEPPSLSWPRWRNWGPWRAATCHNLHVVEPAFNPGVEDSRA